jgi:septal ring factor EnvC (AmiA/AmiB activator)
MFTGIVLLAGAAMGALSYINNASIEKRLKKAQESANDASEAAARASNSFEELSSSLDKLDEHYETLREMRRGTNEWNTSV